MEQFLLNGFMDFLTGTMPKPSIYGWFHLVSLLVVILVAVTTVVLFKNKSNKTCNIILLTISSIMIFFEILKQLTMCYIGGIWDYQWYIFPLLFCSAPMYTAFIAGCLKEGKVKNALLAFTASFGFIGGLIVFLYPGDVFTSLTLVNIQTMVHHGSQIVLGVYLLASKKVKINLKSILGASSIFAILSVVGLVINVVVHFAVGDVYINMMNMNPYCVPNMPGFSHLYNAMPFYVYAPLQIILTSVGIAGFLYLIKLIGMLKTLIFRKRAKK